MRTIKLSWLIGSITAIVLVFGVLLAVKANIKTELKAVDEQAATKQIALKLVQSEPWYFNGALDPSDNDPLDASQYSRTPSHQCDNNIETICSILAPPSTTNPNEPDMLHEVDGSETVGDQIDEALDSGSINDTVTAFRSN